VSGLHTQSVRPECCCEEGRAKRLVKPGPWALTALIAGVISFYASARSLQIGEAVEVIALTSVAANLAAIIGGIIVFHDPIGSGAPAIAGRVLAFCLAIAGAALMPAPMRASPEPLASKRGCGPGASDSTT
jgi:hypothetical protein